MRDHAAVTSASDSESYSPRTELLVVYLLKDDLKHLWTYRYAGPALRFWKGWYDRAMRSRIEPLKRFARRLKTRVHGILAHCHCAIPASVTPIEEP